MPCAVDIAGLGLPFTVEFGVAGFTFCPPGVIFFGGAGGFGAAEGGGAALDG